MSRTFLALALLAPAIPLFAATEIHNFKATLTPSGQNPAVTDREAVGEARIGIRIERADNGDITDAIVDFDLSVYLGQAEELVALHIHRGMAGSNGPIVISSGGLDFGTPSISAEAGDVRVYKQRLSLMDPAVLEAVEGILGDPGGYYYVNLHSASHRPGLVRGQLHSSEAAMISMGNAENRETLTGLRALLETMGETVNRIARRLGLVPAD